MKNILRLAIAFVMVAVASLVGAEESTSPADVSGKWNFEVMTDQGSGNPTFTFSQDGGKLSGTYKGYFGEAPVTGTVKGSAITFTIKANADGQEFTMTYSGTVTGDTMKGTIKFGDMGGATFTGKREPK